MTKPFYQPKTYLIKLDSDVAEIWMQKGVRHDFQQLYYLCFDVFQHRNISFKSNFIELSFAFLVTAMSKVTADKKVR